MNPPVIPIKRRTLLADLRRLAGRDLHLAEAVALVGQPPPRSRPPGFGAMLRIILGQQISAAAATSLWNRLVAAIEPLTPEAFARFDVDGLRAFGLSRQKAGYARGLALDLLEGRLDLEAVHAMDDEAAIAELVKIKGIGLWSAEIYLLFALGRRDIFPSGDLALAVAFQNLKGLRRRPTPERLLKLVEPWRPYRSAGAHFLWHYYANAPMG